MRNLPQACYFVPATRHYSWDKAGALLWIGQANMNIIEVDSFGHMNVNALEASLRKCLADKLPVFSVVAVVGTTGEGAVDPVDEILELRDILRKEGLDFFLHADAACRGYMCSMFSVAGLHQHFVSFLPLSGDVERRLRCLKFCDSVTIDPHKSGYIQYPAGALCYRNGTARFP